MNHSLQETTGGEALMRSRMHAMEQLELLVAHLSGDSCVDWRFVRTHAESLAAHAGDALNATKALEGTSDLPSR